MSVIGGVDRTSKIRTDDMNSSLTQTTYTRIKISQKFVMNGIALTIHIFFLQIFTIHYFPSHVNTVFHFY